MLAVALAAASLMAQTPATPNTFTTLMQKAATDAAAHHDAYKPVLSPVYQTVLNGDVDVPALQAQGIQVIPWTVDDEDSMRALLAKHVDGIITDDPSMLMKVLAEVRATATAAHDAAELAYLDRFDPQGHRGGRALRPENTLPSFENGMDLGMKTLETDTGVTTDGQSLIWHDQFLNPQSCRHADGTPYTMENKVYTRDISMAEAQRTFICDKLHFGPLQTNDLSLSPVAVAFAKKEGMPSPYAPTNAAQLMRFARFYANYYRSGPGKSLPYAAARAHTGETIQFNLETKIQGDNWPGGNHTRPAQDFVDALVGAIKAEHMEKRADVQSFYFGTLLLIQTQHPEIRTVYLTADPEQLKLMVPPELK
ncbi:glycerophosphodiester phosphodiesterase family protein [Granulicella sp. 5B5]|uniref:glycerophosphodiester phosphodiesterase family protein n=1 Tax=Granulicella sp. 5B5 TaxID=1617967 RepID=UPI002103DC09|nr:glycerophosphodiester phosphodiesterase family protein [Granulicella sp. 5B5]